MAASQLRLVDVHAPARAASQDPTRQVFDHWVFMLGRSVARCKLGPTRRGVINAALTLYDVDTLCMAIEGMAADPLADCASDKMRDAMREVEWLLARESRVERWAEMGERLRGQADDLAVRQAQRASQPPEADAPAADPAAVAAARERLRALATQARQQGAGR